MRNALLFLLLTLFTIGCAKTDPTSSPSDAVSAAETSPPDVGPNATSEAYPDKSDAYPEKSDVMRLMHRANTEFSAGRYNEALEIVEQALVVDPASVAAAELRDRIHAVLIRS